MPEWRIDALTDVERFAVSEDQARSIQGAPLAASAAAAFPPANQQRRAGLPRAGHSGLRAQVEVTDGRSASPSDRRLGRRDTGR
jgi:hypothetical protein